MRILNPLLTQNSQIKWPIDTFLVDGLRWIHWFDIYREKVSQWVDFFPLNKKGLGFLE